MPHSSPALPSGSVTVHLLTKLLHLLPHGSPSTPTQALSFAALGLKLLALPQPSDPSSVLEPRGGQTRMPCHLSFMLHLCSHPSLRAGACREWGPRPSIHTLEQCKRGPCKQPGGHSAPCSPGHRPSSPPAPGTICIVVSIVFFPLYQWVDSFFS